MNKHAGDQFRYESKQEENIRWAQEQVQLLMINGRHEDAVKILLQIIDHVCVDGKINSPNDKLFVAVRLTECFDYIHKNYKLVSLLDDLTNQIYSYTEIDIELKQYILYRQHVVSFHLNTNTYDQDKINSTCMYVLIYVSHHIYSLLHLIKCYI